MTVNLKQLNNKARLARMHTACVQANETQLLMIDNCFVLAYVANMHVTRWLPNHLTAGQQVV